MNTIKVILDWFPNTNHTGFYVALRRGYFKEAGLNVQISKDVHGVLETHDADVVLGTQISMLEKMAEGVNLTAIATITQRCDSGIVSLKEAGIESPKDLEGKRLTQCAPRWFHSVVREVMRMDGGDYSKVNLVPKDVGDITSRLGKVTDAVWVYENWENQELIEAGKEINFIRFADVDPLFDYCAPCLGVSHEYIEKESASVRKFLACLDRGYVESANNPKESVLFVKEYMLDVSSELLIRSQKHLAKVLLDKEGHWGYVEPRRWNEMADWLIKNGHYDKRRRTTEFTNEFLPTPVKNDQRRI